MRNKSVGAIGSGSASECFRRLLSDGMPCCLVCLDRIQYIQRGGSGMSPRSAVYDSEHRPSSVAPRDSQQLQLEIYYDTDHPRSEYLYKFKSFQLIKPGSNPTRVRRGCSVSFQKWSLTNG